MEYYLAVGIAVGLCVGAVLMWLVMRGRIAEAIARSTSEIAQESASAAARERILAQELATLKERASRIPEIETKTKELENALTDERQKTLDLREMSGRLTAELKAERETVALLRTNLQSEKTQREQADDKVGHLNTELADLNARFDSEIKNADAKLALLLEAKGVLSDQFKTLANDILEEKSKKFTEQNQTNIGQLLNPLKDRIIEFKTKVEEIHSKDTEQQATLKAELSQLKDLRIC